MNGSGDKPVIHDLDILRPAPEYVRLGGHDIDISFIPSGIAIDITNLEEKLSELTGTDEKMKEVDAGGEAAVRAFEVSAELCAVITSNQYEEMTKEWLLKNTNVWQLRRLMDYISQAVYRSLDLAKDGKSKKSAAVKASP